MSSAEQSNTGAITTSSDLEEEQQHSITLERNDSIENDHHSQSEDNQYSDEYSDDYFMEENQPTTEKMVLSGEHKVKDLHIQWGGSAMQGWRGNMEDRMVTHTEGPYSIFAVFDGHNGEDAADFSHRLLPSFLCENLSKHNDITEKILSDTFVSFNRIVTPKSGTTVTILIIDSVKRKLHLAHLGDSRALIFNTRKKILHCTADHNPTNEIEKERLIKKVGLKELKQDEMTLDCEWGEFTLLSTRMVNKDFHDTNVCRSLGDGNFRISDISEEKQPMSCIPDYFCMPFDSTFGDEKGKTERFDDPDHTLAIFLATDGIWNSCFSSDCYPIAPFYPEDDSFSQFLVDFLGTKDEARKILTKSMADETVILPYANIWLAQKVYKKCKEEKTEQSYRGFTITQDVVDYCVEKIVKPSTTLKVQEKGNYLHSLEEGVPIVSLCDVPIIPLKPRRHKHSILKTGRSNSILKNRSDSILKSRSNSTVSEKSVSLLDSVKFFDPPEHRSDSDSDNQNDAQTPSANNYVDTLATILDKLMAEDECEPQGKSTDNITAMLVTISWQKKEKKNDNTTNFRGISRNRSHGIIFENNETMDESERKQCTEQKEKNKKSDQFSQNEIAQPNKTESKMKIFVSDHTDKDKQLKEYMNIIERLKQEKIALETRNLALENQLESKEKVIEKLHMHSKIQQGSNREKIFQEESKLLRKEKDNSRTTVQNSNPDPKRVLKDPRMSESCIFQ